MVNHNGNLGLGLGVGHSVRVTESESVVPSNLHLQVTLAVTLHYSSLAALG